VIELAAVGEMRAWSRARRAEGRRVGLVPTMGFLHEGHLRLIDRARSLSDAVVLSLFVNPTQFGPSEDFARYPRDLGRDRTAADGRGVACLFAPTVNEMYPRPGVITVEPGPLALHLCGPRRPGHFAGVLTVVAKLLHIVEPDVAVFGRKDAQQAVLVRRMAADLDFPVAIEVAPTTREPDGIAMSSRNVHLAPPARVAAAGIPRALDAGHAAFREGEVGAMRIVEIVRDQLAAEPGLAVEYVEAVDPETLTPVSHATAETLLAVAVRVGPTRLIDNVTLGRGTAGDARVAP
jgi:pantoate--beta-alanine ligase